MFGQDNSAGWAVPAGKRQAPTGSRNRSQRGRKQSDARADGKRVLLFGRVRELALYRAEVLRQNGFHVITPSSRTEAMAAIESGELGAVILSYTLASETVEEMAELIKQKCPECALIAISQTGLVDPQDRAG